MASCLYFCSHAYCVPFTAVISRKAASYLLLAISILITVAFLSILAVTLALPGKLQGSVRSIYIYSPTSGPSYTTIPLDILADRQWLSAMEIEFHGGRCTGRVALVNSTDCSSSSLPVQMNTLSSTDGVTSLYVYSLPGSMFNVSIPNNLIQDTHVWFLHTLEAYLKLSEQIKTGGKSVYECGKHYEDANCSSAKNHTGKLISFSVKHPGYHSILFTSSEDNEVVSWKLLGLEWSFTNVTYNFPEIMERYATIYPPQSVITSTDDNIEPVSVKLSKPFDFAHVHNYCALLHFKCTDPDFSNLALSNLTRRWDVYTLLSVLYFLAVLLLIVSLVVVNIIYHYTTTSRNRLRNATIQSEI